MQVKKAILPICRNFFSHHSHSSDANVRFLGQSEADLASGNGFNTKGE